MTTAALVAVLAAGLGIGVRATYGGQAAVDEPQYLLTALSLSEDGDLDISDELAAQRWRDYHDAELPVQTLATPEGRQLSPHDPLLPVLLAVPMGLGGWVAAKLALVLLAGLTAAVTVWTAVWRFAVSPPLAGLGAAAAFGSPPLAVYGHQVYPEMPAALAVVVAAAALTGSLRWRANIVWAAAVVALPWLGVKYVPVAAGLAAVGLATLLGRGRRASAAALAGGLAMAGAAYLVVHRVVWGGWTVYASGDHFASTGEFSVIGTDPDLVGRSLRLVALLADRAYGLVPWQPAWLLAVPALVALMVARPRHWAVLAVPVAAAWATATWVALTMHGFWWPGRQVVVVLPLLLLAVLWWLRSCVSALAPRLLPYAAVPAALGVVALAALLVDGWAGEVTWVAHFTGVDDPIYQALRVVSPDYASPGPGFWVLHAGWVALLVALAVAGGSMARRARPYAARGTLAAGPTRLPAPVGALTRAPAPLATGVGTTEATKGSPR